MRAELLKPESPRWTELLAGMRHDFYHLPAYLRFAVRQQEAGEPLAFVAEEDGWRFFVPLIIRPIPPHLAGDAQPLFDASCPRGYPGPLYASDAGDDEGSVELAVDALAGILRERGVIAAFSRLHPLMPPPMAPLMRTGAVVEHGDSISIDLTLTREELWRQTNHGHRLGISKATRRGYVARIDEAWEQFDGFVAIYQATMNRLGAAPFWHFTADYFRDLRETLGGNLHLGVVEIGGELAAAGLLTELGGIVEYHLSGTADAHREASPSKLLIDHARWWAKERGNEIFHLTGSLGPGDPLSQFKAGFSPLRHPVRSWRLIADGATYERLVARWQSDHGVPADAADGFFPAYRRPGHLAA